MTTKSRVRIVAAGICHTDLAARDQHLPVPLPSVLGHEGAGIVEKVGARVTKVKPGDHVALSWMYCGVCPSCKSGNDPYCHNFLALNFGGVRPDGTTTMSMGDQVIHGNFFGQSVFASHALAEERNVVKVPQDVPLEILGPMGCGIQTGAGAVMNALKARPGTSIAIFGVGPVGMSAVLAAVVCGCTGIIAVGRRTGPPQDCRRTGRHPHHQRQRSESRGSHSGYHRRRPELQSGMRGESGRLSPGRGRASSAGPCVVWSELWRPAPKSLSIWT